MAKITLKDIKGEVDKVDGIKIETTNIKTATDKIANIETKVGTMETKIEALEKLVGKQDASNDHSNDTGIYKAIYDGFTELMGGP